METVPMLGVGIRDAAEKGRTTFAKSFLVTTALVSAVTVAPTLVAPVAAQGEAVAQVQSERRFDIPAQPLADALVAFGQQSGLQVTVDGAVARGLSSTAVSGTMTADQALDGLLSGSGLVHFIQGTTVVVDRPVASGDGAMVLDAVTVEGAYLGGPTEGTGAYTTGVMNTATPIGLSIRETPQAVTVMTRQRMDDQGMEDITDVMRDTPGLSVDYTDGPGRPAIMARGFYVASVMQDGVQGNWSSYMPTTKPSLAIYDHVEVVRGATGLMQGAGYPSASVNMVRKRPTADFHGAVEASGGRWNDVSGMADVGGALVGSGKLRVRAVAQGSRSESFRDDQDYQSTTLYGVMEADLGEDTLFTFGVSNQDDETDGAWWGGLPAKQNGDDFGFSRSTSLANDWEYLDQTTRTLFARLDHAITPDWDLSLGVDQSWMEIDSLGTYIRADYSGATPVYASQYWFGGENRSTTNLSLKTDGGFDLLGHRHEVAGGLSYNRTDTTQFSKGSGVLAGTIDPLNWESGAQDKPGNGVYSEFRDVTTQTGGYAVARFTVIDPLKVIIGGRLDWYDFDDKSGTSDFAVDANLTKYGGVVLDLDDHHSVYGSYTDIFLPQNSVDRGGAVLTPIVGENYEVGVKGEYLEGALNASLAFFLINQSNRATVVDDIATCETATTCYEASGLVRSKGVDLEVQGALTPNWNVGFGYTYTRTEYIDDPDYERGTRFETSLPEHMVKLSTMYRMPSVLEGLRVGGGLRWQSGTYEKTVVDGVAFHAEQSPYAVVDLVAGYQVTDNFDIQLNINNAFDTQYYSSLAYDPRWGSMSSHGEPISAKLKVKYRW
jgi:outer membrane receptor for ferric coprogen and ferric-rhodotorulic acid